MLKRVAVLALDYVAPFELGVLCEVFGYDRTADGLPGYHFTVCSPGGRQVSTDAGFMITPGSDLSALETADLVAVPAHRESTDVPPEVYDALRRADARGAYVLSVCSGAFLLGEAGLLDGRHCTTHWRHTDRLAAMYPLAKVDQGTLYVADGNILTSAGTAAGIDLCLHLVRAEHGSAVATALARRMVVPPHRSGGQSQFVEAPIPQTSAAATLEPLLEWMITTLDQPHTVETLAVKAHMSPRTFARRFKAETGATPHDWLTAQRVLLARQLLEDTPLGIEAIAGRTGFGTAAALRHHFNRKVGTSPQQYRAAFNSCDDEGSA